MSNQTRYRGGKSVLACTEKGLRIALSKFINEIERGAKDLEKQLPVPKTGGK